MLYNIVDAEASSKSCRQSLQSLKVLPFRMMPFIFSLRDSFIETIRAFILATAYTVADFKCVHYF